jgi:hypothetical protein
MTVDATITSGEHIATSPRDWDSDLARFLAHSQQLAGYQNWATRVD